MSHYKIIKRNETWENGNTMVAVLNTKSGKEHVGFVRPNEVIEIMAGMEASLKRIQLA